MENWKKGNQSDKVVTVATAAAAARKETRRGEKVILIPLVGRMP